MICKRLTSHSDTEYYQLDKGPLTVERASQVKSSVKDVLSIADRLARARPDLSAGYPARRAQSISVIRRMERVIERGEGKHASGRVNRRKSGESKLENESQEV